ncbi:MAG: CPBP family intramembrane metalloprotease [Candidatus Omnitrophica bacterium]|nr:CPBP family intramembrane metalloprotease [Candidatus Omnitrophota bacterium]
MSKKSLLLWIACGVLGAVIFIIFYNSVFPVASVNMRLSRDDARQHAFEFLSKKNFKLENFDVSIMFTSDSVASVYLQKTQGIKKANQYSESLPIWFWKVRLYKELEKEGFVVCIDPETGKVIACSHFLLDDAKGANLSREEALAFAQSELVANGISLNDYELKEDITEKQKYRTDYYFSWERKGFKIADATYRVTVAVYGDTLGSYDERLKIPEEFLRELQKETSLGDVISMLTGIVTFLLTMFAVVTLILNGRKHIDIAWKVMVAFGCIIFAVRILSFFNELPFRWNFYPNTLSKAVFVVGAFSQSLKSAVVYAVTIICYGMLGLIMAQLAGFKSMPLLDDIRKRNISVRKGVSICVVAYSLAFIFLGYITIFYMIGGRFFNIWISPNSQYSNILSTAMPFLFPLTLALTAAVSEELIFRLFMISFFRKWFKFGWLVLLLPALIWAFGHSTYAIYPVYARGIELTFFAILLGVVFLKYGLETVILTHFLMNALLGALPLLHSHNPYFFISGLVVIGLGFSPILLLIILGKTLKPAKG